MRQGFDIRVISPEGTTFQRKTLDKSDAEGKYVRNRIPFKLEFDETLQPNFGRVTLINVNDQHRSEFKKGEEMTLKIGWLPEEENNKFISDVDIINTKTYVRDEGTTQDLDVMFRDTPKLYHQHTISKKWGRGTDVEAVLRYILEEELGVDIGHWSCKTSKTYDRGKSFYLPAAQAIRQVSSNLKVKMFFYNKKAYVMPVDEPPPSGVQLDGNKIMKGPFTKAGTNKELIAQMEPNIKPGHKFRIKTESLKGNFSVYSGKHTSRDGTKLYTILRFN